MLRRAAVAAALALLASPALAAEPKGTAGELAAVMMPRKAWAEGMQQIAQGMQAGMESHPGAKLKYPPDFGAKVRGEVEAALPYDALLDSYEPGMYTKETTGGRPG